MVNQDAAQKFVKQGLTFDDVLLIPAASDDQGGAGYLLQLQIAVVR